ncbi:hypothetical protein [Streptomyces sp. NPDC005805]|uniref:hypothetical protein n=1 Tax=Streptomyces sp. NPDC005805 TaxID=3157068 RepID=UPI0034032E3D
MTSSLRRRIAATGMICAAVLGASSTAANAAVEPSANLMDGTAMSTKCTAWTAGDRAGITFRACIIDGYPHNSLTRSDRVALEVRNTTGGPAIVYLNGEMRKQSANPAYGVNGTKVIPYGPPTGYVVVSGSSYTWYGAWLADEWAFWEQTDTRESARAQLGTAPYAKYTAWTESNA